MHKNILVGVEHIDQKCDSFCLPQNYILLGLLKNPSLINWLVLRVAVYCSHLRGSLNIRIWVKHVVFIQLPH